MGFFELVYLLAAIAASGSALVLRQRAHDRHAIRSRLSQFSVRECICFLEAARPVVYSNIATLMKAGENRPIAPRRTMRLMLPSAEFA